MCSAVLRDINAVCDYLLEAEQWAEELARLPREERGELYGLPVWSSTVQYSRGAGQAPQGGEGGALWSSGMEQYSTVQ